MPDIRPPHLRRTWLFLRGADDGALEAATSSGADVIVLDLEDFTPPGQRPAARARAAALLMTWQAQGAVATIRVNSLETDDGLADLEAAMAAGPDAVLLPKVCDPVQVVRLEREVERLEAANGMVAVIMELVPNMELARGLIQTFQICQVSKRISGALLASEDMAADLGAERGQDGLELAYVRQRFIVECAAAGVLAIDYPYTWSDVPGQEKDTKFVRRLGYKAKSLVDPAHTAVINRLLTPSLQEVALMQSALP